MTFYDKNGKAISYVEGDKYIYLFSGRCVAYFLDDAVYSFSGKHLGWFKNGWIFDLNGYRVLFNENSVGGPLKPLKHLKPLKSIKHLKPIKGIREIRKVRPVLSLSWSKLSYKDFFSI